MKPYAVQTHASPCNTRLNTCHHHCDSITACSHYRACVDILSSEFNNTSLNITQNASETVSTSSRAVWPLSGSRRRCELGSRRCSRACSVNDGSSLSRPLPISSTLVLHVTHPSHVPCGCGLASVLKVLDTGMQQSLAATTKLLHDRKSCCMLASEHVLTPYGQGKASACSEQ